MYHFYPLRLQLILLHRPEDLDQTVRPVDHIHPSARFQDLRAFPHNILQRAEDLMSRDRLHFRRILKSVGIIHIRWICRNDIKGSRSENPAGFLDISMYDLNFLFQMV